MPPSDSRQIKRPRLSLSCVVCRRRKVRCGKERPKCGNCVKMNETCIYENTIRDQSSGQVRRKSPTEADVDSRDENDALGSRTGQSSTSSEQTWTNWRGNSDSINISRDFSNVELSSSNTSPARPPQPRHRPLELAYTNVPSWEEAIQAPSDDGHNHNHNHLGGLKADITVRQSSPDQNHRGPRGSRMTQLQRQEPLFHEKVAIEGFPMQQQISQSENILPPGYLSIRRAARVRYIGKAFWGFANGKESICDDFFDEDYDACPDIPPRHIAAIGLANLLMSLPTKPVCDALIYSFSVGVRPIYPLVHMPTLRTDYDEFWEWCRNSGISPPSEKLFDDPTFICLLFAVLYSGAAAAPASMWSSPDLQGLRKETTVNRLKTAYSTSLSMCQHLEHPTFNTLVSSLLTHSFMEPESESLGNVVFVSTVARIAESMGLHREDQLSGLGTVARELRRRVWWHIVWLDVQSSISTGLPTCCGNEALDAVRMVAETRDEAISDLTKPSPSDPSVAKQSVTMLYAIGRYETARLQYSLINHLQSARGLTQENFTEILRDAKKLRDKINTLVARIPAQGIPEKGFIPSRLANASPLNHPALYEDSALQPTVFATWVRIMLTMLKLEVAILLQKPFLGHPESKNPQEQKLWTSIVHLSVNYLRNYLQLYRAHAFEPYIWFCSGYYGPLQCSFLILIYLNHNRQSENAQLARYCVDEVIDRCISEHQQSNNDNMQENSDSPRKKTQPDMQIPLAKKILVNLHKKLDSPAETDDSPSRPVDPIPKESPTKSNTASLPLVAKSRSNPDPAVTAALLPPSTTSGPNSHAAVTDTGPDLDFLHNISDLEAWSSSLVGDTDDFFSL